MRTDAAEQSRDDRMLIGIADRGDCSHPYCFNLQGRLRVERARIPVAPHVFKVAPLSSPRGDCLLFAQNDGVRSAEIFAIDLSSRAAGDRPLRCGEH